MEMPFTYYTQSQISPLGGIGRHVCLRSISSGESSSLSEGTYVGLDKSVKSPQFQCGNCEFKSHTQYKL